MPVSTVGVFANHAPVHNINMTDTLDEFAKRLKKRRTEEEYSQAGLAEKVGVGQSQIGNFESGKSLPSFDVLVKLVKTLDTNADYLLGLTNDDKPASDLEDQIVVGVPDAKSRAVLQGIMDLMAKQPYDEQRVAYDMLRRMFTPRTGSQAMAELMKALPEIYRYLLDDPGAATLVDRLESAMPPDVRAALGR